jgi:hypothetical protein
LKSGDVLSTGAAETNFPQNVRNVFDESGEWARSSFDHRHQVVANGTFQVPRVSRSGAFTNALLSGRRVSTILTAQSGSPFTVNLGVDQANIGAGPSQRPDRLHDPNLPGGRRTVDRWFDTAAFALPAPFTFGTAPRNSVVGPGFASVDVVLARAWPLGRSSLELRWEVFDVLNRANFDLPNRIFGTPNFGRIFSAKNAREMQIGAKLSF